MFEEITKYFRSDPGISAHCQQSYANRPSWTVRFGIRTVVGCPPHVHCRRALIRRNICAPNTAWIRRIWHYTRNGVNCFDVVQERWRTTRSPGGLVSWQCHCGLCFSRRVILPSTRQLILA